MLLRVTWPQEATQPQRKERETVSVQGLQVFPVPGIVPQRPKALSSLGFEESPGLVGEMAPLFRA